MQNIRLGAPLFIEDAARRTPPHVHSNKTDDPTMICSGKLYQKCVFIHWQTKRTHAKILSCTTKQKDGSEASRKAIVSELLRVSSEILNDHNLNESQDIITCWSPLDRLIIKILMEYQSYNFGPVELFTKLKPLTPRSIRYETQ